MEPVPPPPPVVVPHVDSIPPPPPPPNTTPQITLHAAPPSRSMAVIKHILFSIPIALITGLIGYLIGLGNGSQLATDFLNVVKNPPRGAQISLTPSNTPKPLPTPNLTTMTLDTFTLTYPQDFTFVDPTATESGKTAALGFNFVSGSIIKSLGALVLNPSSYLTFNTTQSDETACKVITRNGSTELLPLVKKFNQTNFFAGQVNGAAAGTTYTSRIYHTYFERKCIEIVATHSNSSDIVDENIFEIWQELEAPLQTITFQ